MNGIDWNPGTLLRLSGSYWQTFALHAGVKMGVFTMLAKQPMTAADAADCIDANPRALGMLLNALCAMQLLQKEDEHYALTAAARQYLVEGSPDYVGYMILHHHHLSGAWARLDEAVHTGKSLRPRTSFSEGHEREAFLMGMYNQAMLQAPDIAKMIDLSGRTKLLDLGGGPGTYAVHFCRKNPDLQAVIFDLPTTRPFAERTIARFGLSGRVGFAEGDYLSDRIDGTYDAAWLSHILHGEGPEACRDLIAKTVKALQPGAMILIHEFILHDTMDGPLFPALFSLNMLLVTGSGQAYSDASLRRMLTEAGVTQIKREAYSGPTESGILSGIVAKK
jgi:predicted O-methyltransferase YrrM